MILEPLPISFEWWWALLGMPLPFIINRLTRPIKPSANIRLARLPSQGSDSSPSQTWTKVVSVVLWCCLVIALARPVWFGEPVEFEPKHRDMMLVVDLSGSMNEKDMLQDGDYVDRLTAVKGVLSDFSEKRQGDRLGVILFGDHAYLQTPLTSDRETVIGQINQTIVGLVGERTAIGDGIGLATKTFIDSDAPQRVIILLSDGSNTAGVLDPMEAAEIAKQYNTVIYTVGVGAGEMQVREFVFSRTVNTAADLDEAGLTNIAELTGGKYFRARNADELSAIYDEINRLEPISTEIETWRPQTEWFPYPLGLAFFLSLVLFIAKGRHE